MGSANRRFTHESLQDSKTVKTLLGALSKGFAKGELTLSDDDDELLLRTAELLTVRIKAEREDGQCQLTLRVSWSDPSVPAPRKGTPRIDS